MCSARHGEITNNAARGRRLIYLPEPAYFLDQHDFPLAMAIARVVEFVAPLSDRFEAWELGDPKRLAWRGSLDDPDAAVEQARAVVAWLHRSLHDRAYLGAMYWSKDGYVLLDQHDGPPGWLFLTKSEFATLPPFLGSHGLPSDLYFDRRKLKLVTVRSKVRGSLTIEQRAYSPLRWAKERPQTALALAPREERAELRKLQRRTGELMSRLSTRMQHLRVTDRVDSAEHAALSEAMQSLINVMVLPKRLPEWLLRQEEIHNK